MLGTRGVLGDGIMLEPIPDCVIATTLMIAVLVLVRIMPDRNDLHTLARLPPLTVRASVAKARTPEMDPSAGIASR